MQPIAYLLKMPRTAKSTWAFGGFLLRPDEGFSNCLDPINRNFGWMFGDDSQTFMNSLNQRPLLLLIIWQKWIASPDHARVWPPMEATMLDTKKYTVLLCDAV